MKDFFFFFFILLLDYGEMLIKNKFENLTLF